MPSSEQKDNLQVTVSHMQKRRKQFALLHHCFEDLVENDNDEDPATNVSDGNLTAHSEAMDED